jgi:phospholipase C
MSTGLDNLKHIVVLMMENRSFDHMLSFLKKAIPDLRGVLGGDYFNPSTANVAMPVTDGALYPKAIRR